MVAKAPSMGPDPADKNGERGTVYIPGGKQYKGQWVDNKITGTHPGTPVFPTVSALTPVVAAASPF